MSRAAFRTPSIRIVALVALAALLASCSRGGGSFPLPATASNDAAAQRYATMAAGGYELLYSFKDGTDGGYPYAGLTSFDGELYGTTYGGGGGDDWGTVFKISTSGQEHVLYRFQAGNDGAHPYDGLLPLDGELYGTTEQGGTSGAGTVFKVSASGAERVIYSFKAGSDGQYPYGRLIALDGELYGTTYGGGGGYGWGVVFKVSTSGEEHVLYRFKANNDGAHPYAGLIVVNGELYGTTEQGGTSGSGTVFKIDTAGQEHVVYSFKGGSDGQYPYARLTLLSGNLYGTTYQGGVSSGWGTVFRVSLAGEEHVLYRFKANDDGAHPQFGSLIAIGSTLYGTTYQGGSSGSGTVFSVGTAAGVERVIYSFKGGTDGQYPYDGLLNVNGTLFGTTYQGGAGGFGTVFKLLP
jgi:uncharacterized repeat protein (TIGR03803 family)